jgi:hypothetical protein
VLTMVSPLQTVDEMKAEIARLGAEVTDLENVRPSPPKEHHHLIASLMGPPPCPPPPRCPIGERPSQGRQVGA